MIITIHTEREEFNCESFNQVKSNMKIEISNPWFAALWSVGDT